MKKNFFVLFLTAFFPALLWAANSPTRTNESSSGKFFAGLDIATTKMHVEFGNTATTVSADADDRGIFGGYYELSDWGYDANVGLNQTDINGTYSTYVKVAGNVLKQAYEGLFFHAGINLIKFVGRSNVEDLQPQLGFQVGAGYNFSNDFGLRLTYNDMRTGGTVPVTSLSTGQVIGHVDTTYKLTNIQLAGTYSF